MSSCRSEPRCTSTDAPSAAGGNAEDGPNLVTQGSTELVHALLANSLVESMSIFTVPVVLGGGKKLFADARCLRPHSTIRQIVIDS